jgi:hypothetical protein
MVVGSVQSLPITTKVVSLIPDHGEVYLIQNDVTKFVSDFNVRFSPAAPVSSTSKADRHDITEILMEVV